MIRDLYRAKRPALFLKIDIAHAFDKVRCDYLMEVLEQMGFRVRWREWIAILLSFASSSVLVNGSQTTKFRHRTGLRQGDPLSLMLFILTLEPLQRLLAMAEEDQALSPINNRTAKIRISLYADDAAVFVNPVKEEVQVGRYLISLEECQDSI